MNPQSTVHNPKSTPHDPFGKRILAPFALGLAAAVVLGVGLASQAQAQWTYSPWTGDADSGITNASPYTVAVNCAGTAATVNGVAFQASALSGSNFLIGGDVATHGPDGNNVTGDSHNLAQNFIFNGTPRTVTLNNLTPGVSYETSFFSFGWDAAGRTQTFASGSDSLVVDQDAYGQGNGIRISYLFTADATGSRAFTITPVPGGQGTFHMSAFANRQLGAPQAPTGLIAISLHHSVRLDWTASIGATGYKVERLDGSGGSVLFTYDASGTSYTDTTVTSGGPYYYVVRATNSTNTGLPSAEASASPSADPVDQTLTFALGTAVTKTAADAPFADTASAFPSGLAVTYSVPGGEQAVATVDASTGLVTLTGTPGTAHILADQAGNGDFNAATQVSQTLTVNQATTVLTWATPVPIPVGTALSGTQLNASSGVVAGEFVYDPPSGTVLPLGTHSLSVQFTPTNTVKYSTPAPMTVTILVTPANSNIAFISGNWSNSGIWNLGHVPLSAEDALILTGSTVAKDNSQAVNSVTVNSGGKLTAFNVQNAYAGNTINLNGGTVRFGRDTNDNPYIAGGNFVVQANSTFDSYNPIYAGSYNLANQYGSLDFAAANPGTYPNGYLLNLTDNGVSYNYNPSGVRSRFTGSIISHSGAIQFTVNARVLADGRGLPTLEFQDTSIRAGQSVTVTAAFTADGSAAASLIGSLGVATLGGAELLTSDTFTMFTFSPLGYQYGIQLTDTSTFDTTGGLWSKSGTTTITATLAASPKGSIGDGQTASFALANAGYVSLTGLTPGNTYSLTLGLASSADQATVMAQLAKNAAFANITAVGPNKVTLQFTAPAATSYFAWDNVHTSSADWHLGGNLTAVALATDLIVSGYASWQSINGASGQTLSQDHDNDGVPNGIEYFLGGPNGNTTGPTTLPGVTKTGDTLSVTWTMGPGYTGVYNTDFLVETSDTLTGIWNPESEGGTVTISGSNVTYTFPAPLGSKRFVRLMVTGP